jgi:hypothetical protein
MYNEKASGKLPGSNKCKENVYTSSLKVILKVFSLPSECSFIPDFEDRGGISSCGITLVFRSFRFWRILDLEFADLGSSVCRNVISSMASFESCIYIANTVLYIYTHECILGGRGWRGLPDS